MLKKDKSQDKFKMTVTFIFTKNILAVDVHNIL